MKRRDFLSWVGVGGVASFLPMAIAACTFSGESAAEVPATAANNLRASTVDSFEPVGTLSELDAQGQIIAEIIPNYFISVIRNPDNSELYAVNPGCTHRGCTVDWSGRERKYICPCHGAEYSPDGTVIKGPARENLPPYLVKIEGEMVLVQAI